MKKYFYVISINVFYRSTGETIIDSQKVSCKGIIEIDRKEDKPSLIYDKIFKKSMLEFEGIDPFVTTVENFNFWEEKELFEDLPIEDWKTSISLFHALKHLEAKNYNDISKYSEGDLVSINFGKRNIIELKSFLAKKGVTLFQI